MRVCGHAEELSGDGAAGLEWCQLCGGYVSVMVEKVSELPVSDYVTAWVSQVVSASRSP